MDEYILFLDETFKTVRNPYFCMAGTCFKRNYYEDVVSEQINTLKKKHFDNTDVIFHYSEMTNKKGVFETFKNSETRVSFFDDYAALLKSLEFTTFGIYFQQTLMKSIYTDKSIKDYHIAFSNILMNYLHFLKSVNGIGSVCIESRSLKENSDLQKIYYEYIKNGSIYFSKKDIDTHLTTIGFVVKGDNCIGLQIADFAPSCLLRNTNSTTDHHRFGAIYKSKLYCNNSELENILGFKNLL